MFSHTRIGGILLPSTAALSNDAEALKVRDWRHKLQKAFLSAKVVPKEEVSHSYRPSS